MIRDCIGSITKDSAVERDELSEPDMYNRYSTDAVETHQGSGSSRPLAADG